jgi:ABC-type uncharacterized transport system permease subunit
MNVLREVLWPVVAVVAAFIVGGIVILILGDNPITAYSWLLSSSFGSAKDIGWTLHYATPPARRGNCMSLHLLQLGSG